MNYIIRTLTKSEFALYKNIRLDSLRNHQDNFGAIYEDEAGSNVLKFSHIFADTVTNDFIYGAFVEDEIIGICGFMQETKTKTRHLGEITQMYVKPSYSGKGIGMKLIAAALNKAFSNTTIEQIKLTVIASNEKAIALYKKAGFVRYGIFEGYYKSGDTYWTETFMRITRAEYFNNKEQFSG